MITTVTKMYSIPCCRKWYYFFYFPELNSLKTVLNRDTEKLGNSVRLT